MADFYSDFISNKSNYSLKKLPQISSGLNRELLVSLLLEQNTSASERVISHIKLLSDKNTFSVVTGQQLGILGGPLYTFYKLLNTVQVCEELKKEHPENTFVPIFWLEGEDADFEEVSSVTLFNNDRLEKINYDDSQVGSIGKRILEDSIKLFENESFTSGKNWVDAFYDFFKPIFDEYGIIVFHSNRDDVRKAVKPFWNTFLSKSDTFRNAILGKISDMAENDYSVQVPIKEDETFTFKHTSEGRVKFKSLSDISETDELSPNVLLRPLMQDWIFPTAVYVAGAAEISYQNQLADAYTLFDRSQPILFPRTHITLINSKMSRLFNKYSIKHSITYDEFKEFKKSVFKSEKNDKLDQISERINEAAEEFYNSLEALAFTDKASMDKILEGSKSRQLKGFEQVAGKITSMLKRSDEDKIKQVSYMEHTLFPFGEPQERVFPVTQFTENLLSLSELFMEKSSINSTEWQFLELK